MARALRGRRCRHVVAWNAFARWKSPLPQGRWWPTLPACLFFVNGRRLSPPAWITPPDPALSRCSIAPSMTNVTVSMSRFGWKANAPCYVQSSAIRTEGSANAASGASIKRRARCPAACPDTNRGSTMRATSRTNVGLGVFTVTPPSRRLVAAARCAQLIWLRERSGGRSAVPRRTEGRRAAA